MDFLIQNLFAKQAQVKGVRVAGAFYQESNPERSLVCPVCSSEYGHVARYEKVEGLDDYKAWSGRGDLHKLVIEGECGHTWNLCVGEHKGQLALFVESQKQVIISKGGNFSPKLRWQIMERDGHRCVKCGRSAEDGVKLHVDHIYPNSKGGEPTLENGQTLCDECNIGKGASIPKTHPTQRGADGGESGEN